MGIYTESVQKLYVAYFNRPADVSGLAYWETVVANNAGNTAPISAAFSQSPEYVAAFAGMNNDAVVNTIYLNLFGRSAEPAGLAFWSLALDTGRMTVSDAVTNIAAGALTTDLTAYNNKVTAATAFTVALDTTAEILAYSGATANASAKVWLSAVTDDASLATQLATVDATVASIVTAVPDANVGQTFTLTTGADTATGATLIDGSRFLSGGTFVDTLNSSDKITGTAGTTDKLFVQAVTTAATTTTPTSITGVEILTVENTGTLAYTLSLANGDALLKTVNVNNSTTAGGTVSVTGNNAALTTLGLSNVSTAVSVASIASAVAGTADAVALTLSSVATAGTGITMAGYETINLASNGTVANTVNALVDTSLATLNISGTQNVTLTLGAATTPTTINAATATGRVNVTVSGAGTLAFTGGTANDTINMFGTYSNADTINGGAGTADLLISTTGQIAGTSATQTNVSNVELLGTSDALSGAVSLTNFGATGFQYQIASATANTINYSAGTGSLDLQGFAQTTGLIVNAAGVATTDILNMTLGTSTTASGANTLLTSNGFETINLVSQGGANSFTGVVAMTNTAATEALNITGNQSLTITGITTADVINASGMTGAAALILTGGAGVNSATITGTANADTLIGGAAADIISGGAGDDIIRTKLAGTASAADVLTGGTGQDTFVLIGSVATAADYSGAAVISDFTYSATASATDILALSATVGNYVAGGTLNAGIAGATAAGATIIQNVAQNAAATAAVSGLDLVKLTTGVIAGASIQAEFNAAIGSASVTATAGTLATGNQLFVSFYDTTNSKMVVVSANTATANDGILDTGDAVTLIGTLNMSAADYANFGTNQFAIVA